MDHDGEFFSLVSQTDVLAFIASQIFSPVLQQLAHSKVMDAKIGTFGQVHSVSSDEPALTAFQLISEKRIHGVAVVDKAGHLVSNISASDLRLIQHHGASLAVLFDSAADFVRACSAGSTVRGGAEAVSALSVGKEATYVEVLLAMHNRKAHRIYVVDEKNKPIGVVSQIDLIRAVHHLLQ